MTEDTTEKYWHTVRTSCEEESLDVLGSICKEGIRPSGTVKKNGGVHIVTNPTASQNYYGGGIRELARPRTVENNQYRILSPGKNSGKFISPGAKLLAELEPEYIKKHASVAMDTLLRIEGPDCVTPDHKKALIRAKKKGIAEYVELFKTLGDVLEKKWREMVEKYRTDPFNPLSLTEAMERVEKEGVHTMMLYPPWNADNYLRANYGFNIVPLNLIKKEPWRYFGERKNIEFEPYSYLITDGQIPPRGIKRLYVYDVPPNKVNEIQDMLRSVSFASKVVPGH